MARRIGPLIVALLLGGCAPKAESLLARHDYREALCAASAHEGEAERRRVRAALERDLAPTIHIHAVTRAELEPVLGADADALLARVVLLRVRASQNDSNIGRAFLDVELPGVDKLGAGADLMASLTGEQLPAPREVTVDTRTFGERVRDALRPAWFIAGGTWNLLTLGLIPVDVSPRIHGGQVSTSTEYPSRTELVLAAPRAMALAEAGLVAWERPREPASLRVRVAWAAHCRERDAVLEEAIDVVLATDDRPIEDRIDERFGRFIGLRELRDPPRR